MFLYKPLTPIQQANPPRPAPPLLSLQMLSAFTDVLRALAVALGKLLPEGAFHPVAHTLDRLAREYRERFAEFNKGFAGPRRAGA